MTQDELAGMVGVSRSTLASIEGKKRNMEYVPVAFAGIYEEQGNRQAAERDGDLYG